jgi:hypothetical protein
VVSPEIAMAYRINAKFKDGTTSGPLADIVAAEPPHHGDTIRISRQGHDVTMLVTAIWTPAGNRAKPASDALIMVEAREV